ncbi:hypothetical protein FQN57_000238 [Myotisia sp. PD_48]|nr:hypothetical protein FQN57_000238 [Myotisia sp. PD_48]
MRATTIAAASAGTVLTGLLAYAIYFDYKRHADPEFRRSLKRDNRRLARAVKQESEAKGARQMAEVKDAAAAARNEPYPDSVEEREVFFMTQVSQGEALCADSSNWLEAATCFYKALKVYPKPQDLISIYDRTVPKEVLELLAEFIALDPSLTPSAMGSDSGLDGSVDE